MKSKNIRGLLIVAVMSCLFWTSYSVIASAQKNIAEEEQCKTLNLINETKKEVYYELHNVENGESIPATVYVKNKKVVTFDQIAGGLTPRERADILVNKLTEFIENNKNPARIFPGKKEGSAVVKYEDKIIFTADENSAKERGVTTSDLALRWANSLRSAFEVQPLLRDYELIKKLDDVYDENILYQETGMASWYGEYFHGRTAADGSIYNMYEYTAAHKTLPFGSIVKVTNKRNGESCVVRITDRGPFIEGRIIDLSVSAAKEIGMYHSGISDVKIEVIGRN